MGAMKTTTIVLVSLILIALLISITNVTMSLVYPRPNFDDFCDIKFEPRFPEENNCATDTLECTDGTIASRDPNNGCEFTQCDTIECRADFNTAQQQYNQIRFYIFAGLGFLLMLAGLLIPEIITTVVGLATGGILITQGIVFNFENKIAVIFSLVAIFIIILIFTIKTIKRLK